MATVKSGLRIPQKFTIEMSIGAGQYWDLYSAKATGGDVTGTASHTDPKVCPTKVLDSLGSNYTAKIAARQAGRVSEIERLKHGHEIEQQQIQSESLDI